jgi:Pyridine nucleotide-disulphide oxidoreductase
VHPRSGAAATAADLRPGRGRSDGRGNGRAIAELAKATLARDFRHIDPKSARILLVEAGPRLLATFPEKLSAYARSALARMGVDVRLETMIEHIDAEGVIARGERIPAATVIWSAGVRATSVGRWLGVATARNGTVRVEPDLSVPELPEVCQATPPWRPARMARRCPGSRRSRSSRAATSAN